MEIIGSSFSCNNNKNSHLFMALLPLFMAYSMCVEHDEKTEPRSLTEVTALNAEDVMEVLAFVLS